MDFITLRDLRNLRLPKALPLFKPDRESRNSYGIWSGFVSDVAILSGGSFDPNVPVPSAECFVPPDELGREWSRNQGKTPR